MAKFSEIPRFTKDPGFHVDVMWRYLPDWYAKQVVDYRLDVNPPFQRPHVWSLSQKVRYCEFILKGGTTGKDIYLNCPDWNRAVNITDYVLVDGKQRLDAVLGFMNDEFPVFGAYRSEYTDAPHDVRHVFHWHVNDLTTWDEILQWYLDLNRGGVIHTDDEITRVQALLGQPREARDTQTILADAGLDRDILRQAIDKAKVKVIPAPKPPTPTKRKRPR